MPDQPAVQPTPTAPTPIDSTPQPTPAGAGPQTAVVQPMPAPAAPVGAPDPSQPAGNAQAPVSVVPPAATQVPPPGEAAPTTTSEQPPTGGAVGLSDPRLQHLIEHYLPAGMDVGRELQFVVEHIDADGNRSFEYRPHPVSPPAEAAPGPAAVVPAGQYVVGQQPGQPAQAQPVQPVAPNVVVSPAPAAAKSVEDMSDDEFDKHYQAMLAAEIKNRPSTISGL